LINLESPFDEKLFQPAWLLEIISFPPSAEIAKLTIDEINTYRFHYSLNPHSFLQAGIGLAFFISSLVFDTTSEKE
jgi:hypothetical protein